MLGSSSSPFSTHPRTFLKSPSLVVFGSSILSALRQFVSTCRAPITKMRYTGLCTLLAASITLVAAQEPDITTTLTSTTTRTLTITSCNADVADCPYRTTTAVEVVTTPSPVQEPTTSSSAPSPVQEPTTSSSTSIWTPPTSSEEPSTSILSPSTTSTTAITSTTVVYGTTSIVVETSSCESSEVHEPTSSSTPPAVPTVPHSSSVEAPHSSAVKIPTTIVTETVPVSTAVTIVTASSTAAGAGTEPAVVPSPTTGAPVVVPTGGSNKGLVVPSGLLGAAIIAGLAVIF